MHASLCFISLILSAIYVVIFVATVAYLLYINKCKFNKRTKVVILILSMTMTLQLSSTVITFIN